MSGFASLSSAQMRAILKEAVAAEKSAAATERATAFAGVIQPVFDAVVTAESYTDSDKPGSTWAGFDSRGHKVVIDGREYSVSVRITDVTRSAEKATALEELARAFLLTQQAPTS